MTNCCISAHRAKLGSRLREIALDWDGVNFTSPRTVGELEGVGGGTTSIFVSISVFFELSSANLVILSLERTTTIPKISEIEISPLSSSLAILVVG